MSIPFDDNKISYLTADKITIKTTNNDEEKWEVFLVLQVLIL